MNLLVYKDKAQTTSARDMTMVAPPDAQVSQVLYSRLQAKDEERYSDYSQRSLYGVKKDGSISHSMSEKNLNQNDF